MKNSYKKLLSIILSLCLCIFIVPGTVNAVTVTESESVVQAPAEMTDLEMIMAGIKTVEEVYGKLDEATVPEIVGYNEAVASNHVERLYEDEGNDLNKVVFLNADGSKTAYLYDYPVKYIADNGKIKDITLKIEEAENSSFRTADNSTVTTFSANAQNGITLSGNGASVVLVPQMPKTEATRAADTNKVISVRKVNDKTVAYTYDAKTSIEYSLTYTGFKEDIVVSEYTGKTEYDFTLYTNGLELVCIDGSYYLVDSNDNVKATLGDIIIFTADERNNTFGTMRSRTIRENEEYILTIVIDPEFLADENTIYPIRIDPTVEITYDGNGSSAISDVTINSLEGSSGTSSALMIGKRQTYGISRVLMKFPGLNLSSLGSNISITNATVRIRDILCETTSMDISCYIFTGNEWNESTVSWANVNANSYSDLLSFKTVSYSNGTQQSNAHWYVFNITDAVEGWRTGNCNPNKGIIFKSSSSVENGSSYIHKTFASFNRASYKPSLSVTYSGASSLPISEDTYYLNNMYFGKYMQYLSPNIAPVSGTITNLGASIRWEIFRVEPGFVIRSTVDSTKYLGVPDDPTNDGISVVTVTESAIPSKCIWNISFAAGTGCLIRNYYNFRYLFTNGNTIYTTETTSTSGTNAYYSRVWRLISVDNMALRELSQNFSIDTLSLMKNKTASPNIRLAPTNAIWSELTDFEFSNYDTDYVSFNVNNCSFTALNLEITDQFTVTGTHKVTGQVAYFSIVINPQACLLGIDNEGHDHWYGLHNSVSSIINCGYSNANVQYDTFTESEVVYKLNYNLNGVFVSRSHGGQVFNASGMTIGTCIQLNDENDREMLYSNSSLSNVDLSNLKLVLFIGCKTGYGGETAPNLPSAAVNKGATTAVGFRNNIYCEAANDWTKDFFFLMEEGKTVEEACVQLAKIKAYVDGGLNEYVICGDPDTTLK